MKLLRALAASALLALMACGSSNESGAPAPNDESLTLELGAVPTSVKGNVVSIPVDLEGVRIVKADGDTSGDTGHFHVFIDRDPVAVGETIPKERSVAHSAENPIRVFGLKPGEHDFTVVVGDGTHKRIHGELEDSATVDVKGPSVWGSAPSITEGDDLTVELESEDVEIRKADDDTSGKSGHFHVLVDPATPPQAGDVMPEAKEGSVYHTPESSLTITGPKKGEHILWIVLGDGKHTAFDALVMDKLTVTVT